MRRGELCNLRVRFGGRPVDQDQCIPACREDFDNLLYLVSSSLTHLLFVA